MYQGYNFIQQPLFGQQAPGGQQMPQMGQQSPFMGQSFMQQPQQQMSPFMLGGMMAQHNPMGAALGMGLGWGLRHFGAFK